MELNIIIDFIIKEGFNMKDVYYLDLAHIVSKEISRTMKINDESEDTIRQQAKIISINRNRNKDNNNDNYSPAA